MKYSLSRLPHDRVVRRLELYGTRAIPTVREMLRKETPSFVDTV